MVSSTLEHSLVEQSVRFLASQLRTARESLGRQPNGRLRRIAQGLSKKNGSGRILGIARDQLATVIGAPSQTRKMSLVSGGEGVSAGSQAFLDEWFFTDAVTRRDTAIAIKRQMLRNRQDMSPKSIADQLRSTFPGTATSDATFERIAEDIFLFCCEPAPTPAEIREDLNKVLSALNCSALKRGYSDIYDVEKGLWRLFVEVGSRGDPGQVKFRFSVGRPGKWHRIIPLHLNVGYLGPLDVFLWDQLRGSERASQYGTAARYIIESVTTIVAQTGSV
jgi:hypothetical protein